MRTLRQIYSSFLRLLRPVVDDAYAALVLASNPLAFYRLDEGSYDVKAGLTAKDASSNKNDGNYVSTTIDRAALSAATGKAKLFTAGQDLNAHGITTPISFAGLAAGTLSAWVRIGNVSEDSFFAGDQDSETNRAFLVGVNSAGHFLLRLFGTDAQDVLSPSPINDNRPRLLTVIYKGTGWDMLIDGAVVATSSALTVPMPDNGQLLRIGGTKRVGTDTTSETAFLGELDDVAIYDVELLVEEVAQQHDVGEIELEDQHYPDLLAYYDVERVGIVANQRVIYDRSQAGAHATVENQSGPCLDFLVSGVEGFPHRAVRFGGPALPAVMKPPFTLTQDFGFSGWLHTDKDTFYPGIVFSAFRDGTLNLIRLKAGREIVLEYWDGSSLRTLEATPAFDIGYWNHVAVSWQTNGLKELYLNGELVAVTDDDMSAVPYEWDSLQMGGEENGSNIVGIWDGRADRLRWFNRSLAADEVFALYDEIPTPALPDYGVSAPTAPPRPDAVPPIAGQGGDYPYFNQDTVFDRVDYPGTGAGNTTFDWPYVSQTHTKGALISGAATYQNDGQLLDYDPADQTQSTWADRYDSRPDLDNHYHILRGNSGGDVDIDVPDLQIPFFSKDWSLSVTGGVPGHNWNYIRLDMEFVDSDDNVVAAFQLYRDNFQYVRVRYGANLSNLTETTSRRWDLSGTLSFTDTSMDWTSSHVSDFSFAADMASVRHIRVPEFQVKTDSDAAGYSWIKVEIVGGGYQADFGNRQAYLEDRINTPTYFELTPTFDNAVGYSVKFFDNYGDAQSGATRMIEYRPGTGELLAVEDGTQVNLPSLTGINSGDTVGFAITPDARLWIRKPDGSWATGDPATDTAPTVTGVGFEQVFVTAQCGYDAPMSVTLATDNATTYKAPDGFNVPYVKGIVKGITPMSNHSVADYKDPRSEWVGTEGFAWRPSPSGDAERVMCSDPILTKRYFEMDIIYDAFFTVDSSERTAYYRAILDCALAEADRPINSLRDFAIYYNNVNLEDVYHTIGGASQPKINFDGSDNRVGIAVDPKEGKVWIGTGGAWAGGGDPALGTNPTISKGSQFGFLFAGFERRAGSKIQPEVSLNFGKYAFRSAVPAGFNDPNEEPMAFPDHLNYQQCIKAMYASDDQHDPFKPEPSPPTQVQVTDEIEWGAMEDLPEPLQAVDRWDFQDYVEGNTVVIENRNLTGPDLSVFSNGFAHTNTASDHYSRFRGWAFDLGNYHFGFAPTSDEPPYAMTGWFNNYGADASYWYRAIALAGFSSTGADRFRLGLQHGHQGTFWVFNAMGVQINYPQNFNYRNRSQRSNFDFVYIEVGVNHIALSVNGGPLIRKSGFTSAMTDVSEIVIGADRDGSSYNDFFDSWVEDITFSYVPYSHDQILAFYAEGLRGILEHSFDVQGFRDGDASIASKGVFDPQPTFPITGALTQVPDGIRGGQALYFDGSSHVDITQANVSGTYFRIKNYTLGFWFRTTSGGTRCLIAYSRPEGHSRGPNANMGRLLLKNGNLEVQFGDRGAASGSTSAESYRKLNDGQWHLLLATTDYSGELHYSIDGTRFKIQEYDGYNAPLTHYEVFVGRAKNVDNHEGGPGWRYGFIGDIAAFEIYGSTLSDEDAYYLWEQRKTPLPGAGVPALHQAGNPAIEAIYTFNDDPSCGSKGIEDKSGKNNHATLPTYGLAEGSLTGENDMGTADFLLDYPHGTGVTEKGYLSYGGPIGFFGNPHYGHCGNPIKVPSSVLNGVDEFTVLFDVFIPLDVQHSSPQGSAPSDVLVYIGTDNPLNNNYLALEQKGGGFFMPSKRYTNVEGEDSFYTSPVDYTPLTESRWMQLAIVWRDNGIIELYLDGTPLFQSPGPAEGTNVPSLARDYIVFGGVPLPIGASDGPIGYFKGRFAIYDNIRFYRRALTPTEIGDAVPDTYPPASRYRLNDASVLGITYSARIENNRLSYSGDPTGANTARAVSDFPIRDKRYFEVTHEQHTCFIGLKSDSLTAQGALDFVYEADGTVEHLGTGLTNAPYWGDTGNTVGLAYDPTTGNVWIRDRDGNWLTGDPAAGTAPYVTLDTAGSDIYAAIGTLRPYTSEIASEYASFQHVNFGGSAFKHAVPEGFNVPYDYQTAEGV